ncbi:MAG: CHASE2 domain-containing protein [Cyanobacteria bacterium P01_D01_bin.1]
MVDQPRQLPSATWAYVVKRWWQRLINPKSMVLILGVFAAICVLTIRSAGVLQIWELQTFDWMMNHRPAEQPDERIVIIGITEADIERSQRAVMTDTMLAEVIEKVRRQGPTVIGLDLFRNVPTDEGYERLRTVFSQTPNLIGIEKVVGDETLPSVAGNSVLVKKNQVAASDLIIDVDGRVRRGFLFPSAVGDRILEGFAFRVALEYLESHDVLPNPKSDVLELGFARLLPFERNSGGYRDADAGGYQIVMNWRSNLQFQTFDIYDVLDERLPWNMLKDKIVLIGSMQSGDADVFFTPYSAKKGHDSLIPSHGIEVHASLTSQIISAAFGQRPPIRMLSSQLESLVIVIYTCFGIGLYHWCQRDFQRLQLYGVLLCTSLCLSQLALMLGGWWLPIVPASIALLTAPLVTRLHKIHRLKTLSEIDELTRLANRRSFQKHLASEWQRAVRSRTPISLILCDIDYFKLYNDTYGHPAGDQCLRQVASAIGQSVRRPGDLAARYGGEEFVILLPNTNAEGAQQVAKDAGARVRAREIEHKASKVSPHVSISLGLTTVTPTQSMAISILLDTADLGLYKAKQQGRNRLVMRRPWAID